MCIRDRFDVALIPQPKTSVAGFRAWARRREADDARRAAEQRARFERRGVRARGRGDDDAAVPDDFPDAADVARRAADFWRTIGPNEGQPAPEYGADVDASIFAGEDESAGSGWNLHGMPSCRLRPFLARLGASMPGVNRGMLYFGAPRAFFAWHVEDANLYSINYLHCGAPKSWYALSPERSRVFERLAGDHFPEAQSQCRDFLRHKNTLLTPQLVAAASGLLQYEGDMVGSGYHLGQWDHKATGVGSGVTDTGPLCIFAADLKTSVVLSPLGANVMTSSQKYSGPCLLYTSPSPRDRG